jgi:hypothetical protein
MPEVYQLCLQHNPPNLDECSRSDRAAFRDTNILLTWIWPRPATPRARRLATTWSGNWRMSAVPESSQEASLPIVSNIYTCFLSLKRSSKVTENSHMDVYAGTHATMTWNIRLLSSSDNVSRDICRLLEMYNLCNDALRSVDAFVSISRVSDGARNVLGENFSVRRQKIDANTWIGTFIS